MFSEFIAELFSFGEHFTKLVKKAFPDSKNAENFQCDRSKTACIVKKAFAPHYMDMVLPTTREGSITIMMDESNKRSDDKACAILVRMFDETTRCIVNRFLGMPIFLISKLISCA